MHRTRFFLSGAIICLLLGITVKLVLKPKYENWQSKLLSINKNGDLIYHPDDDGFILPDFSHAGYKGGGIPLPDVPVIKIISAQEGDNTFYIQTMIDSIGMLPKDSNGFRGALLLNAGRYEIYGSIHLKYDGVVLRGVSGNDDPSDNTIIYARGNNPVQRDVIVLGADSLITGEKKRYQFQYKITSPSVAVGSLSFPIENLDSLDIGDQIIIYHPCTSHWLEKINYGGVPAPSKGEPDERWKENMLPIVYNRYITNIENNTQTITIDAPVFYTLNTTLSPAYIYKPDMDGTIRQVGIENLRIEIETSGETDENHAWQAIRLRSVENVWVRNCTLLHFGQSGIITEATTRTTIENCSSIDPVSVITGERRYNFNTSVYSQLILFKSCYARNGRHNYISNGTSTASGNVFLRCISEGSYEATEGHRKWTHGMLFDNYKEIHLRPIEGWRKWAYRSRFVLGLYNREDIGTGHGWSAVQSVLWNCDVDKNKGKIVAQKPPTSQNYAIGCIARDINGRKSFTSRYKKGYVEGKNKPFLQPASLYEAQLEHRIKK